jgi:hypothetical protein
MSVILTAISVGSLPVLYSIGKNILSLFKEKVRTLLHIFFPTRITLSILLHRANHQLN